MFLGVMEGVRGGGVVMQRVQVLPLALTLRSRMKQEIGNFKITIKYCFKVYFHGLQIRFNDEIRKIYILPVK